jgi:hypothetical protein
MKKTIKLTLMMLALAATGVSSQAAIISWAYANGLAVSGTAGVVPAINWNLTGDGGSAGLLNNSGASTSTTLSLAGGFGAWGIGGGTQDPDGTYNSAIFDGYYNCFSSTLTLGSIPFANYDIYVYFSSDANGRTGTISDGTTAFSFSTDTRTKVDAHGNFAFALTTDTGVAYPSADYAVFSGLTGASKAFTIASNPNSGMGIAGVQIVQVPEPATFAMFMGGIGMLTMFRRRCA